MTKITISDVRNAGFCVSGLRDFADEHGLDFRDFVKNGIDSQVLIDLRQQGIVEIILNYREAKQATQENA